MAIELDLPLGAWQPLFMQANPTQFNKINNICLVIIAAVAVTSALIYTRSILLPFIISLFAYAVISPASQWFQKKLKVPRVVAIIITFGTFALVFTCLVIMVSNSLEGFIRSADLYKDKIVKFVEWGSGIATKFGVELDNKSILSELRQLPVFAMAKKLTGGVVSLLSNSILIAIFILFLMAGEGKSENSHPLIHEIQVKVSRYVATKLTTSVTTGLLVWLILAFCRIELAFMFGVLTILLNFIPSIGSIIATALPIPVLLLQVGFGWQFYVVLILSLVIQFVIGNVLEPKFMGESMDLHPVAIMVFLMFWGLVWGLPGMFLAVPITAILKIILSRIETTKPIAELLAGRIAH